MTAFLGKLTARKTIRAIVAYPWSLVVTDLLLRSSSSPFRSLSAPVAAGLAASGVLLLGLCFLATADWLRQSAARQLAAEAATAAALAAAKTPDAAGVVATAAAKSVSGDAELVVSAERGDARPSPSGLAFTAGPGEVISVTVSTTSRSLLGTLVGLGQRTVSVTSMAARSGIAALTARATVTPELPAVSAAIEAHLLGPGGALGVTDRVRLGRALFRVADLVAELGHTVSVRDGGTEADVAAVASASFKPSELLAALAALYRDSARTSADAADVLAILERLAAAGIKDEPALPFAALMTLGASETDLALAAPLRPLEFIQALMRARLAQADASIELRSPVAGVDTALLRMKSDSTTAALLVGGENGLVGIPGIHIAARFALSGLSIPGAETLELPLEVALTGGDARIQSIACAPAGPEISVIGRPVRASVMLASEGTASPAGASDYALLLAADGLTVWGKGRSAFADDPPVELLFRPGIGNNVASLRAPIDFRNRLERLATETQVLVSLEGSNRGVMSEGGVRDEIARVIVGSVRPVGQVLSSVFATFGVVPGKMDVEATGAACNGASLLGEAK